MRCKYCFQKMPMKYHYGEACCDKECRRKYRDASRKMRGILARVDFEITKRNIKKKILESSK